jgi:hypothetical protein
MGRAIIVENRKPMDEATDLDKRITIKSQNPLN